MPSQHHTTVWISEGCIACGACPVAAPEIFTIPDDTALIQGSARLDGVTDDNSRALSPLRVGFDHLALTDAVEGCPVEVIHVCSASNSASDKE